jgi:DNA-3-methyladenine glycosylase I
MCSALLKIRISNFPLNTVQNQSRCGWVTDDPLYIAYHDNEWGIPLHDDRRLFELLLLEGSQAGLSWITVLRKRENYRKAFDHFGAEKISRYTETKKAALMQDAGIIRNRLKIEAAVLNAHAFLRVQQTHSNFDRYIWQFTDGKTIYNRWHTLNDIPTSTKESDAMSKQLKRDGFKFVGSTICYAFMQASGMVNDHVTTCFRHHGG